MSHLAPENKGWAQSWERIRKLNAASFKCQMLFQSAAEQRHLQEIHWGHWVSHRECLSRGTPQKPHSPSFSHILEAERWHSSKYHWYPRFFCLPLLICVPKWFSGSHQLLTINLQQNKIHILFPAQFHPYPALLQEGANGNRPCLSWLLPRENPLNSTAKEPNKGTTLLFSRFLESTD